MTFLEPSGLLLLLAGILVIIVYLLRMPRRRRIFSSSLILRAMERLTRRERRKLRTVLSFVAVFLAFLAIVLDAARPYRGPEAKEPRDHILLLDISASMKASGGEDPDGEDSSSKEMRFERAVRQAEKLIDALPVGDRMMIMALGDTAQIVRSFEPTTEFLKGALKDLSARDTGTNWQDARRLLSEVLPTARSPICHFLTDGSGFVPEQWQDFAKDADCRYYDVADAVGNVAITNFRARTTFHSDRDFEVIVEIHNFSEKDQVVDLDLYLDDLIMETRPLKVAAGRDHVEVFQQRLRVGGVLSGRLANTTSGLFRVADIQAPAALAARLRDAADSDPVSKHLREKLSKATQELLGKYREGEVPEALEKAMAHGLAQIIDGDSLYDETLFEEVKLSDVTERLVGRDLVGKDVIRFNRRLLEDAYPEEIARSPEADVFEDALAVDNAAYDVIPSPVRPKVLIYSEETSGFLAAALSANSNALAYRQAPARYSPNYAADIVVFYNVGGVEGELPNKDLIFVNTKGQGMPVEVKKDFENPMMRVWDRHHPLMNYLSLSNLLIASAQDFSTPGWAETLAETASGPLIVAGETPERQLVYIGLDPRKSDLPFRVALPMLVANAILWMKERAPDPDPLAPGDTHRIQLAAKDARALTLVTPDGAEATLPVNEEGVAAVLDTRQAGVYRHRTEEESGVFVVNLNDSDESNLKPSEALTIAGKALNPVHEKEVAQVWRLWPKLALFALILLLIENALYHRRVLF